jgi:hypothetical protein
LDLKSFAKDELELDLSGRTNAPIVRGVHGLGKAHATRCWCGVKSETHPTTRLRVRRKKISIRNNKNTKWRNNSESPKWSISQFLPEVTNFSFFDNVLG